MFEFVSGIVTGYLLTWPALIVLLLAGIFFEHSGSRKLAIAAGIALAVVAYGYYDVQLKDIVVSIICYFVIGVLWSFLRYRRYVIERLEFVKLHIRADSRDAAIHRLAPSANLDRITAWIIVWPFSAIEHILSDVIAAIKGLVTRVFKGVYHNIYTKLTVGLLSEKSLED